MFKIKNNWKKHTQFIRKIYTIRPTLNLIFKDK